MDDARTTTRQAQGVEPSNPYQSLCLHPSAPRELIDEAYWTLVERVRTAKASAATESRLAELNRSYAILSDTDRRQEFDSTLPTRDLRPPRLRLRRSKIWPLARKKFTVDYADFYHLLRIDPDAGSEIVALAYRLLSAQASGQWADTTFLRHRLLDAYEVLRNPARRATYDASIGIGVAPSRKQAERVEEPVQPTDFPAEPAPESAAPQTPDGESAAAEELELIAADTPPVHLRADPEPASIAADAPIPSAESDDAAIEPISISAAQTTDDRGRLSAALRRVALTVGIGRSAATVRVTRKKALVADAEQRLLTVNDGDGNAAMPATPLWHPDHGAAIAGAELVFIDGPRAGGRVAIGQEAVTMGSAHEADVMLSDDAGEIAPQHVRIWQYNNRFVLRQIADNGTLIGGQAPVLPVVILDDGDEIQIGMHRMRFSLTV
jgi:curved DNA-binding protein CbpA